MMGLLRVIHRWRKLVLGLAGTVAGVTAIVMLFLPNQYTARGTILLEAAEMSSPTDLLGQLGMFTGLGGTSSATEVYLAILGSDRVGRAVIDSLELIAHHEIEGETPDHQMEQALAFLRNQVDVDAPDLVTIVVRATDTDPQLAASIVNAYLHELAMANQTLSLSRSRRTRHMVENALAETENELARTQRRLKEFQQKHGAFSLDEQTRFTIELIAEVQGKLIEAETQREALSGFRREDGAQLRNLDLLIEALRRQIDTLVGDDLGAPVSSSPPLADAPVGSDIERFVLPLSTIPDLIEEYAQIFMDLEVQKAKYTVLATKLEQTKVEESQSIPEFDVLDEAVRPYTKSGPNRKAYVLIALFSSVIAAILLAVVLEDLTSRIGDETRGELRSMLPGPLGRWLSRSSGS